MRLKNPEHDGAPGFLLDISDVIDRCLRNN